MVLFMGLLFLIPIFFIQSIGEVASNVSYSSYGAEILACDEADNRGFYIKQGLSDILRGFTVRHILHVDIKRIYDTITTLHDGKDYRLHQTLQRIRDFFESGFIDVLTWIAGVVKISDPLTKYNPDISKLLNKII